MKQIINKNIIDKINCHVISLIILMNAFQIILAWDFGFIFNMWIEYVIIIFLVIINKFKIVNMRNIITIGVVGIIFAFNKLFNDSKTLAFYVNQFVLFALPLILIFMINIDIKHFIKVFYIYNIINLILYLLLIVINPDKLIADYMTFGFYAIFSAIYVLIYAYYNKKKIMMTLSILALPLIFINGNRGTILIAATAILLMILMNATNIKKKIFLTIIIVIVGINATNILKGTLDFITKDLGVSTYSINSLYRMLDSDNTESAIGGRYDIYQETAEEFKNHTIFGIGVGTFQEKYGYFAHNIFLDAYSTFGIIMATIYFIYLFYIGFKMYKISIKNIGVKILFIFMVANVMKLMLSKTFIYDPTIWLYISLGNFIVTKYGGILDEKDNSIYTNIQ